MGSDQDVFGPMRAVYNLELYRESCWQNLASFADRASALAATERIAAQPAAIEGLRLVRVQSYAGDGFSEGFIIYRHLAEGQFEADPLWRPDAGEARGFWRQIEDLYADPGREEFRCLLGKYLDERRLTPLELLHSSRHMKALDGAGTVLQGIAQKAALARARVDKIPAPTAFKELIGLFGRITTRLAVDAERMPALVPAPGEFGRVAGELDQRYGTLAARYHLRRGLAELLNDATSWAEKLDRLGRLCTADLEPFAVSVLDAQIAEIMIAAALYRELTDEGQGRVGQLAAMIGIHAGTLERLRSGLPDGLAMIVPLIGFGPLVRSRAAVRRRLLQDLQARPSLVSASDLLAEMEAQKGLLGQIQTTAPGLAADEETLRAFEERAGRAITVEVIANLLGNARRVMDKLTLAARAVAAVGGPANQALVFRQIRTLMTPDDVVRLCQREAANRLGTIGPLNEVLRLLRKIPVEDASKQELADAVDAALLDVLKTEIANAPRRNPIDRIATLIKLCLHMTIGEGKARAFLVEAVGREIKNPKQLPAVLERMKSDEERKDTLLKLHAFLGGTADRTA